ncbi:MAG TPA: dockerin type I domain-containing protein [Chthoniobacterales bacterium]|nr:dockerin type I domain-containing protein [Chthoniobacterales bacterium]
MNSKSRWFTSIIAIVLFTIGGFFLSNALARQRRVSSPSGVAERTAIYAPSSALAFSTSQVLVRPPITPTPGVTLLDQDLEPEIKVDIFGNIYVTAIHGVPGGVDLWKSINGGTSFVFMGEPDGAQDKCNVAGTLPCTAGAGGGDDSIDLSSGGYLYISSLYLAGTTVSTSFDGGTGGVAPLQAWQVNPNANGNPPVPVNDRQWLAAYGPQTVYMTFDQAPAPGPLWFVKSTDAGRTFSVPMMLTGVGSLSRENNIVVDQYNGNIYTTYEPAGNVGQILLLRSKDGGATWTTFTAYTGPVGTSVENAFPILAVDRGGNLHLVFTRSNGTTGRTNAHVFLTSSTDQGATWLPAVQVDSGVNTQSTVMPWVVAGSPGIVDITWYGSSSTSPDSAPFDWHLFFAQTTNALAATPTFTQVLATPEQVHNAAICGQGGNCGAGTRNLAEYYTMTIDPDGNANIAFVNGTPSQPGGVTCTANCRAKTWFTKQTAGPSAYAPPSPPGPATFAANIALPNSTNDAEPGLAVDSFNCIYATTPGNPDVWKSTNAGASFFKLPTPPVLPTGGGDEDIATVPSATRPAPIYLADLALADVSIRKSTNGGASFAAPGTGGSAGELNASSDRQWIASDLTGATLTMYEMDHELASEAIRFASSTNDSPWVTTTGITDPELQGSTIPNTNPGPVFVNHTNHTVYGVFTSSIPTTNAANPPFGKQPNVWAAVGAGSGGAGMPPGPFTDYPIFKGLIDSPTNPAPPAGTQTFGSTTANDFPGGDVDAGGNVYAVWAMNNTRTNQYAVWISSSHDGGKNFYGPFQVSSGPGSAEMPWIAGGDNGRVDIVFYQTTEPGDPNTANLHWNTMFAQSLNAHSREPVFTVSQLSDHIMHFGPICNNGLLCGSGTRNLLDFFKVAISSDGLANVVYTDTGNANSPSHITFARQNSGPLAKQNPTFPTCLPPPPPPVTAVSRKTHGSISPPFDVDLLPPAPGIECRTGTPSGKDFTVVVTFPVPVTVGGDTVSSNDHLATADPPSVNGAVVTVNLHNVSNAQRLTITLIDVSSGSGDLGNISVPMAVLLGDVDASGRVDSTDVFQVRQQSLQNANSSNFRTDVDQSGRIDSTDVFITRQQTLTSLP